MATKKNTPKTPLKRDAVESLVEDFREKLKKHWKGILEGVTTSKELKGTFSMGFSIDASNPEMKIKSGIAYASRTSESSVITLDNPDQKDLGGKDRLGDGSKAAAKKKLDKAAAIGGKSKAAVAALAKRTADKALAGKKPGTPTKKAGAKPGPKESQGDKAARIRKESDNRVKASLKK